MVETFDLKNQEVFSAGTWNGDKYEEKDLDIMIEAYNSTAENYKPKIKLTHDHPQGWPSVGWMENLRRVGTKIVADFKGIPKKVFDIIQAGGYSGKSAEIMWNPVINGKKFPYFMKAVALLGIDMKGCENISDMMASLYASDGGEAKAYKSEAPSGDSKTYTLEKEKENEMDKIEQLEKNLAESETRVKELEGKIVNYEKENGDLKKQNDELSKCLSDSEAKIKEYSEKAVSQKVDSIINGLIAEKKLAPANKEKAYALVRAIVEFGNEKKYKFGEKESTLEDVAVELLGAGSVELSDELQSNAGKRNDSKTDEPSGGFVNEDLNEKATEYAKKHKVDYKSALRVVAREGSN